MDELDYQRLCRWVEGQHANAVAALQRIYEEQRNAIDALWERHRTGIDRTASENPFEKHHGSLIEAVRRSARRLNSGFSLQDIETLLRNENPLLMAQSSRKSISTALRRLYDARELALIEEGRGTKPARYAVANFGESQIGKERPMHTVSGRTA